MEKVKKIIEAIGFAGEDLEKILNVFFASVLRFINEASAMENIKALVDGSISMISKPKLKLLVKEIPAFKDFYIGLLETTVCGIDASRHDLIVLIERI